MGAEHRVEGSGCVALVIGTACRAMKDSHARDEGVTCAPAWTGVPAATDAGVAQYTGHRLG